MKLRNSLLLGVLASATASCSLDMSRYPTGDQDASAGVQSTPIPPQGPAQLSVDISKRYQTLVGFGAAVAWYASSLASFAEDAPINDLAFRDLGLDIIRFRDRYGRQDPNNYSDITDEVTILARATKSLGHAPKILLSSWSPPGNLKASGLENCSTTDDAAKNGCTLAKEGDAFVYDQFADYLVKSLDYYASAGIVPDYLSIQNEPNYFPDGWEGCHFTPSESADFPGYDKALSAVRAALSPLASPPKLLGPEPISLSNNVVDSYVTDATRGMYDAIGHHLYSGGYWQRPDNYHSQMSGANTLANGIPLFQTEFDTQGDEGTGGGFETALVMHNSLAIEGVAAFLYWGLIWPGTSGSLISVNRQNFAPRAQYYAMRQYSRYTDPGYVRVDATSSQTNVRVSAYLSPDGDQLTLVLLNVSDGDQEVSSVSIGDFLPTSRQAYQSTFRNSDAAASDYWQSIEDLDIGHSFKLPSHSVLTVVLNSGGTNAN